MCDVCLYVCIRFSAVFITFECYQGGKQINNNKKELYTKIAIKLNNFLTFPFVAALFVNVNDDIYLFA